MISFACNTDDPVSRYGINHFITTTGLCVQHSCTADADISVGYGAVAKGLFSVSVIKNSDLDYGAGEIATHNQRCPLFQTPTDTSGAGSNCIAEFISDGVKYPCISGSENGISIGFDIFRLTGSLLSGYLDKTIIGTGNEKNASEISLPLVDFYEDILFRAILSVYGETGVPCIRKSHWPSGKEFAVCLTHDVDELKKTYQWITRPLRYVKERDFAGLKNQLKSLSLKFRGYEPYWTFDDILLNEKKEGVCSTYFFLKESGEKSPFRPESWHLYGRCHSLREPSVIELMQKLSSNGHEIGVHGSTFSHNNPELLNKEKKDLEVLLGRSVEGIRQHRLNLTVPDTWEYQSDAGFLYDTTLGYRAAEGRGFRWGTCFPFHPESAGGMLPLLEIPLSIMDITLQGESDGWNVCSNTIETVRNLGGALTLLWHPAIFNELEYPEIGSWYWKIIQTCKEHDAWITTGQNIASWWQERENTSFTYHQRGDIFSVCGDFSGDCSFDLYVPDNKSVELISENVTLVKGRGDYYVLCPDGDTVPNEIDVRIV